MFKQIWQSKRFWTGVISLITGLSLVFTGEKTWNDQLPEIIMVVIGIVQTYLGITSNDKVKIGNRVL